ncbi:hypothetical protein IRT45_35405 [Nocardia sp. BSTN01]|uniref:hypothetical protein n=1 Tax=Nocardia sp. BSTN01 TaxID=2783665 RepID=UPI00188F30D1|nr:hypothetical protein [Nocardia sp. BSTN01]MBF5002406.1 hypothetical protein [Nocardia sp. BSTN01]
MNSNRPVQLVNNQLVIADALATPFQVGGVSYEMMPFTPNYGCEFEIRIDGNIIQQQFFAMALSSSWTKVGFSDLTEVPMIAVWRDVASTTQNLRVIVYRNVATIDTLAQSGSINGLINNNWYRIAMWVERDRFVRVYINNTLYFAYWLPAQYKTGLLRRGINLLNQTTNPAYIRNFILYDRKSDFPTMVAADWALQHSDDFSRADGAVNGGWTQYGTAAGIVGGKWSSTGTTNGSRGLVSDTGATDGRQRVEGVFGSAPNGTADSSLLLRVSADGSTGLAANYYSGAIYLARFTGGLTNPTMLDYQNTPITLDGTQPAAFSCDAQHAWIEIGGQTVLMADLNGAVPVADSWAGARVERTSGVNSPSWDALSVYRAA